MAITFRLKTASDRIKKASLPELYEWLRARATQANRIILAPEHVDGRARSAVAYVNHGHWVADCPAQSCDVCAGPCRAAMDLLPDRSAPYLCGCCHNQELSGRWRPVLWPTEKAHREIEAALTPRELDRNRNWWPHETAAGLRAENKVHGVKG